MRLNYFDYFRAIAIFFIVAGHSLSVLAIDTISEMVMANIITGGTALFVFISGFFFHHIFYRKFHYKSFMLKKVVNVFLPYVILSTTAFILIITVLNKTHPQLVNESGTLIGQIVLYFKYIWTGRVLTAYWYIPFIMIVFALSPLYIRFIECTKATQAVIFLVLLTVATIVQRPSYNISPIHSLIYYTPIYMLGAMFSMNSEQWLSIVRNKSILLSAVVLCLSLLQIKVYGTYDNFHKDDIFSFEGVDVIILQKVFLIFLIISVLLKIEDKHIPILKYVATVSFPIFFIHPWILLLINYYSISDYFMFLPGVVIFGLITTIAFVGSIVIANMIKFTLKQRSNHVIGW
jgi:peptidoglycan/LPS O-acetylase OafA/YrhL